MMNTSFFNAWVTCPKPNSHANLRLFCFPHAGGGAQSFHRWSNKLPMTVEVCPIELPGRGIRLKEPPFTRLEPLVRAIAQPLLPYLNKPFAFFGHSMGALLAFELARVLWRDFGKRPDHLFVCGRRAPQIPDPDLPIHNLPETVFLEQLRYFNGTPKSVLENTELMRLLLPTLRADFVTIETYVYTSEPPLNCPISAFSGVQDPKVSFDGLEAWREQTIATFSMQMFPGDHFFLQSTPSLFLQFLSQKLHELTKMVHSF